MVALFRFRFQFRVEEFDDACLSAQAQQWLTHHVGAEQRKEIKGLAGFVEGLGKLDGVLKVNVVIGQSVDQEERPT